MKQIIAALFTLAILLMLVAFPEPKSAVGQAAVADFAVLEQEIFAQTNAIRQDPPSFIPDLEALKPRFKGNSMVIGHMIIRTREGIAAIDEAIAFLKTVKPLPAMLLSKGLTRAARDHQEDQAKTGGLGHDGSDKSRVAQRIARYGTFKPKIGENISYGSYCGGDTINGRMVVIQLLVDDGIKDRGHRKNLFHATQKYTGIACGPHPRISPVCVITYATGYTEKSK